MIVPDVNLLLYAYDADSGSHERAREWWQACLSGTEVVGLALVVAFGFVRVGTSPKAFRRPMTPAESAGHVRAWVERPVVQILDPGPRHVEDVLAMLEELGAAANLVTDAQIAALALEHGGVVHTTDADFVRFRGVRWLNPLTGSRSGAARER